MVVCNTDTLEKRARDGRLWRPIHQIGVLSYRVCSDQFVLFYYVHFFAFFVVKTGEPVPVVRVPVPHVIQSNNDLREQYDNQWVSPPYATGSLAFVLVIISGMVCMVCYREHPLCCCCVCVYSDYLYTMHEAGCTTPRNMRTIAINHPARPIMQEVLPQGQKKRSLCHEDEEEHVVLTYLSNQFGKV